jgi:flagellar basal-body rod protein FlgF
VDSPGYIMLSRLGAQLRSTQVLANNLANADTPGFRAERAVFAEFLQPKAAGETLPGDRGSAYAIDRATWRDTAAGSISNTGNPFDLALQGDGFFAVETPRGERYTRAGRFALAGDGKLTDAEGNAVLDARGTPIVVGPNDTRIEVRGDGSIRSENGPIGQLRVVRFEDPQKLKAEGARLFASDEPGVASERPGVVQGAVENSNVQPVMEITTLTAQMREFQFATQFVEREGERLSSAVERILRRR